MENISLTLSMEHLNDSNHNTDNSSDIPPEPPLYIVITSTLLYVLIFLVGILGNILVIIVITFSHSMKTTVNMYLMNLCVADILVIIVCMPTALADIFTKEVWYFGEAMCKYFIMFQKMFLYELKTLVEKILYFIFDKHL
jgi:hypothetical protein